MGQTIFPVPASGRAYTITEITATGTFTVPTTMDGYVDILCVGGGGGGGKNNTTAVNNTGAGGGGGGGFVYYSRLAIPATKVLTVTIGAGGTGKTGTTGSGALGNYTNVAYVPITGGSTVNLRSVRNAGGPPTGTNDNLYSAYPYFQGYRSATTVTYGSYGKGTEYSYWDNKGSLGWFTTASRSDVGSANPASSSPQFPTNFLGQGATTYFEAQTNVQTGTLPPLISIARATNYGSNGTNGTAGGTGGTANNFGAGIGLSGGGGSSGDWSGGSAYNGAGGGGGGSNSGTAAGSGGNASANSGGGGGGGACSSSTGNAGDGGNGGSGLVVIGYWA